MIKNFIFSAIAVAVAAYILPNAEIMGESTAYLVNLAVVVIVLAIVNTVIRPIISLVTLPINIMTLGLFSLFINGFMVWLVDKVLGGFTAGGWWGAFLFGIVISLVNIILPSHDSDRKLERR